MMLQTPVRKYDRLTGTLSLQEWQAFSKRQQQRGHSLYSILYVDIDHLRAINDRFGHQVSDLTLRLVASTLLYKISWKPQPVWRVGGDEFLIFMRGLKAKQANSGADSIRSNLRPFKIGNDTPINLTIGIAGSQSGASWERIVFAAGNAVHRGKHEGCNRIIIANSNDYKFPDE